MSAYTDAGDAKQLASLPRPAQLCNRRTMFCVMCRSENPEGGRYCWKCGEELVGSSRGPSSALSRNSITAAATGGGRSDDTAIPESEKPIENADVGPCAKPAAAVSQAVEPDRHIPSQAESSATSLEARDYATSKLSRQPSTPAPISVRSTSPAVPLASAPPVKERAAQGPPPAPVTPETVAKDKVIEAIEGTEKAALVALVIAGLDLVALVMTKANVRPDLLHLNQEQFEGAIFHLGLMLVLAFAIYRGSRPAAVILGIFFPIDLLATIVIWYNHMTTWWNIINLFVFIGLLRSIVWVYKGGIGGTFAYHRLKAQENAEAALTHSRPNLAAGLNSKEPTKGRQGDVY